MLKRAPYSNNINASNIVRTPASIGTLLISAEESPSEEPTALLRTLLTFTVRSTTKTPGFVRMGTGTSNVACGFPEFSRQTKGYRYGRRLTKQM